MRQVQRVLRSYPADVRICWDLDNTLVNSGALLQQGMTLRDAVVEAHPVPNMLAFFEAIQTRLPEAEHVIVSARRRSMRVATDAWLRRYGLTTKSGTVCFVPGANAKVRVWNVLASGSHLVIVDDLSHNHEAGEPSSYEDLVVAAGLTARVYVGREQIDRIVRNRHEVETIASETVDSLGVLCRSS